MIIECDVDGNDRTLRIAGGVVLAIGALFLPVGVGWRMPLGILAVVALMTATVRFCPLNALNTCADARSEREAGG